VPFVEDFCKSVPKIPVTPVIDGLPDCGIRTVPFAPLGFDSDSGRPDAVAEYAIAVRSDGLYVYVVVTDPTAVAAAPTDPADDGDAVEIYVDSDGKEKPFYMGCYGIGVGRTMAAIAEVHHDEKGIIWPQEAAPFSVELIALDGAEAEADKLYAELQDKKVEVLYDDRSKNAGEKFADADLLGIPLRAVVSKKTLAAGEMVEIKRRGEGEARLVPLEEFLGMF
jgi:hypothetical protein